MKRVMLMMVLAALLLTQCRKPSIEFPTPSVTTTVSMTITAGPGSKTDISTEGGIVWSANDKIYVGDGAKCIGCLSIVSGVGNATGTFTGEVTATAGDNRTFHFYYLGSTAAPAANATEVTVDFSSQDIYADGGKLKNASGQHVGYGKVEGVDVEADKPITGIQVDMKSKVAIAYFHFESGETPTPYEGALTLGGDHIYNSMTVGFGGTFSPGTKGDISIAGGHAQRYVMLVPPTDAAEEPLYFDGEYYGMTVLYNGIEANKFYRVDGSMPIVVKMEKSTVNFGVPDMEWSKKNLGARNGETPASWYGDYYAWGATETWYEPGYAQESPQSHWKSGFSDGYSWAHCPYTHGTYSDDNTAVFTKYVTSEAASTYGYEGFYDGRTTLELSDDAAHAVKGGTWRMPTRDEFLTLYNNNTFLWLEPGESDETYGTGFKAVTSGYLVIKGKDSGIDPTACMFLPAAGNYKDASLQEMTNGFYWLSTLRPDKSYSAYMLNFTPEAGAVNTVNPTGNFLRFRGLTIRPVRDTPLSGGGTTNDFGQGTW